jgi:hypothetical protein
MSRSGQCVGRNRPSPLVNRPDGQGVQSTVKAFQKKMYLLILKLNRVFFIRNKKLLLYLQLLIQNQSRGKKRT